MRRRLLPFLVLLAAFCGAPPSVSGSMDSPTEVSTLLDAAADASSGESAGQLALLAAILGVMATALISTALALSGRRRERSPEPAPPAQSALDTAELLERRAVRRARERLIDDPAIPTPRRRPAKRRE